MESSVTTGNSTEMVFLAPFGARQSQFMGSLIKGAPFTRHLIILDIIKYVVKR